MTRNLTRITILLMISLLYIETDSKSTSSSSAWFQEKYLDEKYNHYYKYAFETDYEDRITCPEVHKPAMMNAVTGATQYSMTRPRRRTIPTLPPPPSPITVSATTPSTDPPLFQTHNFKILILDITIRDIVIFIAEVLVMIVHWMYYAWQVILMTVLLSFTITVTILVLVMFFGQY